MTSKTLVGYQLPLDQLVSGILCKMFVRVEHEIKLRDSKYPQTWLDSTYPDFGEENPFWSVFRSNLGKIPLPWSGDRVSMGILIPDPNMASNPSEI